MAQINIGRIKGVSIDDPIMKEFVDNLDSVNALAENSKGFLWRLKDETTNATNLNPYNDEQIVINLSVWKTIVDLENFVYRTFHTDFFEKKKRMVPFAWQSVHGYAVGSGWTISDNSRSNRKIGLSQKNGASQVVFDYKNKFPRP